MKVVEIRGGLGNQMFQYAFYLALKHKYKDVFCDINQFKHYNYSLHNGYELAQLFAVKPELISIEQQKAMFGRNKLFRRLAFKWFHQYKQVVIEKGLGFSPRYLQDYGNVFLRGYWQSEKYFTDVKDIVRQTFRFPQLAEKNADKLSKLANYNLIAVHVRRGDYVNHPLYEGICILDYYQQAIAYMSHHVDNPYFIFFSDDPNWCQQQFQMDNMCIVDWNAGGNSYQDMQMMSLCQHNIIANSSFSWWGAWLNDHVSKIVISPKKWLNDDKACVDDIIPQTWIKM